MDEERERLISLARDAAQAAYVPYSHFAVGAALRFADGSIVTGSNMENASYGLSLCAETVAVAKAMAEGRRGGLLEVAIVGSGAAPATPCGRCRQVIGELADLGETDPLILSCGAGGDVLDHRLSDLLPAAFGPRSLED